MSIAPEAEIRRRLRALHGALQALQAHPFARDIGKAVAGVERELVALVGSARAYEIVEEVRVATGFGAVLAAAPPTTGPDHAERLAARARESTHLCRAGFDATSQWQDLEPFSVRKIA